MTTTCYTRSYIPYISTHDARPGTQALVVSRADKIAISALFASSLVRNNISFDLGGNRTHDLRILDLPSLCRLSYEVGQRKSGTTDLGGESRRSFDVVPL